MSQKKLANFEDLKPGTIFQYDYLDRAFYSCIFLITTNYSCYVISSNGSRFTKGETYSKEYFLNYNIKVLMEP